MHQLNRWCCGSYLHKSYALTMEKRIKPVGQK
jgi:hypothetical protein